MARVPSAKRLTGATNRRAKKNADHTANNNDTNNTSDKVRLKLSLSGPR